jgi:hypothetical protein
MSDDLCPRCGELLNPPLECPHCAARVDENGLCPECRHYVGKEEEWPGPFCSACCYQADKEREA